ncbi:hypothetical protein AX16_004799 [Volvariella volvacea WC 439]|nr:hypothetical protein AX16_004799 [Volvariella volvacea WC 439]
MSSSNDTTRQYGTGSNNFLPHATVYNTGNMSNAARDVNLNYHYSTSQEVSPRERLLKYNCSQATFNGDIRADAPKCHKDIRRSIISSTKHWAMDVNSESHIFWLRGLVGTGNTAIASRVCEELNEDDPILLAGSFFFWRNDNNRNSLKRFISTIIYRISVVMPEVGKVIEDVILNDPSVLDAAIEYQWNALVIKPLCQIRPETVSRRSLIVIDGLDECEPSSGQQKLLQLLVLFHQHHLSHCFSFLICSRPESHIQSEMDLLTSQYPTHFLPSLMLSDTQESREDMCLILTSGFRSIHRRRRTIVGSCQWPPEGSIKRIISLAQGQFTYVLTILRWLDDEEGDPVERLNSIFETPNDEKAYAFAPVDLLYNLMISSACSKKAGYLVLPCLFLITGGEGCQVKDLARLGELLEIKSNRLRIALQPLHSILKVPDSDYRNTEVYHTSFVEYLHDASRSGDYCVFNPKVPTFLLPKAVRWASTDAQGPYLIRLTWLHIQAAIPGPDISFTPDLSNALAQMISKYWLRTALLFVKFDLSIIREKYDTFRQRLSSLPEERKNQLDDVFPHDLFPPPGEIFSRHLLHNWAKGLQSGVLSHKELVVFLCILHSWAQAIHFDSEGDMEPNLLIVLVIGRFRDVDLLPNGLHACKARNLVHSAWEYLANRNSHDLEIFLYNLATQPGHYSTTDSPAIGTKIIESIFIPVDVLFSMSIWHRHLFYNSVWDWLKLRNSQTRIEVDRRTLMTLKELAIDIFQTPVDEQPRDKYTELSRLFKHFEGVIPASLLAYLQHLARDNFPEPESSESAIAQISSMMDEEIAKYPIECKCDEVLGLKLPSPSSDFVAEGPSMERNYEEAGTKPVDRDSSQVIQEAATDDSQAICSDVVSPTLADSSSTTEGNRNNDPTKCNSRYEEVTSSSSPVAVTPNLNASLTVALTKPGTLENRHSPHTYLWLILLMLPIGAAILIRLVPLLYE